MATINSGFSTLCSIYRPKSRTLASSSSSSISLRMLQIQVHGNNVNCNPASALVMSNNKYLQRRRAIVVTSVAEEDTLIPEEAAEEIGNIDNNDTEEIKAPEDASTTMTDQPVSVPVSPSDILTMFFQAEGAMNETAIPTVTNALEETEGITNLKVQVVEGIATVELTKQTTVQATGVASNLVEIIQGSGFKLQTLNLSFEDEEDII
ncbi:hypothetical protein LOK49_LG01G03917 [Camellia lanceoleosa]|uniref:Uncharacterized protein n=1 Tax=Camellia lanceoleosa TaxID=1840588 RepID=A0ACC0J5Y5_9ERIC|nr:hypothetical protein LOK49_LG01G03917 [Camellia lanceoleosa]